MQHVRGEVPRREKGAATSLKGMNQERTTFDRRREKKVIRTSLASGGGKNHHLRQQKKTWPRKGGEPGRKKAQAVAAEVEKRMKTGEGSIRRKKGFHIPTNLEKEKDPKSKTRREL